MGHCKFLVANLGIVQFKTFLDFPTLHAVIDSIDSLPVTFLHQLFMTQSRSISKAAWKFICFLVLYAYFLLLFLILLKFCRICLWCQIWVKLNAR